MSAVSRSKADEAFIAQFGVSVRGGVIDECVPPPGRVAYHRNLSQWLGRAFTEHGLIGGSSGSEVPRTASAAKLLTILSIAEGWGVRACMVDPAEVLRRAGALPGETQAVRAIVLSLQRLLGFEVAPEPESALQPAAAIDAASEEVLRPKTAAASPMPTKGQAARLDWHISGNDGVAGHARLFALDWGQPDPRSAQDEGFATTYGFAALDAAFHRLAGRIAMSPPRAGDAYVLAHDPRTSCAIVGRLPRVPRDRFAAIAAYLEERLARPRARTGADGLWTPRIASALKPKLKDWLRERSITPYGFELRQMVEYFWELDMRPSNLVTGLLLLSGDPGSAGFGAPPADAHEVFLAAAAARVRIETVEAFPADMGASGAMPPLVYDGALRAIRWSDAIALTPRRGHDFAPIAARMLDDATAALSSRPRGSRFEAAFESHYAALAFAVFARDGERFRRAIARGLRCPRDDEEAALDSLQRKYRRLHLEAFGEPSQGGNPIPGGEGADFTPHADRVVISGLAALCACPVTAAVRAFPSCA